MKQLIKNYSFDKTAKTVTFTDFTTIRLDRVLLITDVTNNTIIYQFNNSSLGGTANTNVLTLTYNTNTSAFANSDSLQIHYDSASGDPTYDAPSIANVAACKLVKSGTVSEQVTCTNANTDYPMANAIVAGTKYLVVYCASACIVSMGEATSATIGVYVGAGQPTVFPVTVIGTTADDKAHVQSATAGAVVRFTSMAVEPDSSEVFNVMDYGAHRDGATDDVAHVQAAVNACNAAGGGIVYMPAGDYYFYAGHMNAGNSDMGLMVGVLSGVHLQGAGEGVTNIRANRASFHPVAADRATGIRVSDMTILVQDPSQDSVKIYACDEVTIDHVTGGGAAGALAFNGICVYGGNNVAVSDCLNAYCGNAGVHLSANAIGLISPAGSYGTNLSATDCESHHCAFNFRTAGKYNATAHRVDGVTYLRCNGHNAEQAGAGTSADNYLCTYADNIAFTDCIANTAERDNISLIGIHTAAAHNTTYSGAGGTAVHVDSSWGVGVYGSSTGITEA